MDSIDLDETVELGDPPEEILAHARDTMGETPELRERCIMELKALIKQRDDIVLHKTDDAFFLRFLRARKFDVERALRLMVRYFHFRKKYPEHYSGVEPLKLTFIGEDDVMAVPPYREQSGRRILIYRIGNWDPYKFGVIELFKVTQILFELCLLEQRTQILGGICIIDLRNITHRHTIQATPARIYKGMEFVSSYPVKIHAIHVLYQSKLSDMVYNVFKHLLNKKMRNKIHFHGKNMASLHAHIHPQYLPEMYGGLQPEFSYTEWISFAITRLDVMKEIHLLGYKDQELEKKYANLIKELQDHEQLVT